MPPQHCPRALLPITICVVIMGKPDLVYHHNHTHISVSKSPHKMAPTVRQTTLDKFLSLTPKSVESVVSVTRKISKRFVGKLYMFFMLIFFIFRNKHQNIVKELKTAIKVYIYDARRRKMIENNEDFERKIEL